MTATLTYTPLGGEQFKNVRLTVARNGSQMLDQDLGTLCDLCAGAGPLAGGAAVRVTNLDGAANPEPEVVVDLWTGGVNCCGVTVFYRLTDDGTAYRGLVHDFGRVLYRPLDLNSDGVPELITADESFDEAFTAPPLSGEPLQILDYDRGALRDVTRLYPARIRHDASLWRRSVVHQKHTREGDLRGLLAPYVADECLLGRCSVGLRLVHKLQSAGYLSGRHALLPTPRGARYVQALRRLLRRGHYL